MSWLRGWTMIWMGIQTGQYPPESTGKWTLSVVAGNVAPPFPDPAEANEDSQTGITTVTMTNVGKLKATRSTGVWWDGSGDTNVRFSLFGSHQKINKVEDTTTPIDVRGGP